MKKNSMKITAIACASAMGLALAACGGGSSGGGGSGSKSPALSVGSYREYQGVHDINVTEGEGYFFQNGQTQYQIVYPENASSHILTAVSELRLFLGSAGGGLIDAVTDNEYTSGPYISVGDTTLAKTKMASVDRAGLKDNGFVIRSEGKNVYILGATDNGSLNGAYDFLTYAIGFRVYAADEVQYEIGDISFKTFDVRDVPDIDYRVADVTRRLDGDENYRTRVKYNCTDDVFMYALGTLYHNDFYYLPPATYKNTHRDWYSESNGSTDYRQLCYTAHGKEEELNQMLEIVSDIMVDTAKTSTAKTITFMQQDINSWCQCTTCRESYTKYGANSAVVIKFINRLSDLVNEKLESEGMGDRELNICFFAYQQTESAPVNHGEDGSYTPVDESVILRDNAFVLYAPIYASYNESIFSSNNQSVAETLRAWNAISKRTYVWLYQTNFSHYLYPYNTLPTMAERYRYLASQGVEYIFDQNQWDQITAKTAFHSLKGWMGAKLAWNVNADYNALLDEYFEGYFHDAAAPMRKLFDGVTLHMEYLAAETDMDGGIYFNINQYRYFPKPLLDGWLDLINEAHAAIQKYRNTDEELFKHLERRIAVEGISVRYMLLDMYASRYSPQTLLELQTQFMQDCFKYGVEKIAEIKDITSVFENWGLM